MKILLEINEKFLTLFALISPNLLPSPESVKDKTRQIPSERHDIYHTESYTFI